MNKTADRYFDMRMNTMLPRSLYITVYSMLLIYTIPQYIC